MTMAALSSWRRARSLLRHAWRHDDARLTEPDAVDERETGEKRDAEHQHQAERRREERREQHRGHERGAEQRGPRKADHAELRRRQTIALAHPAEAKVRHED